MKNKVIWLSLSFLLVAAMLLASCAASTTTSTPTSTTTYKPTSTTTSITTVPTTATTTTSTTTTVTGNWWDSLGKPQYGGTMTFRIAQNIVNFDPFNNESSFTIMSGYMEELFATNWTLDPSVFNYRLIFRPDQYTGGNMAKSWEFTSPNTFVVHLRQGILWQNIPPANGRAFTADDVVFHYDRMVGLGDGFTKPAPYWSTQPVWMALTSVTATDNYTVVFNWSTSNAEQILETIEAVSVSAPQIENPDAVKQWGDLNDWHHAIGTGPFILKDFISGSSATLVKNPIYWGYDERYPQNKLPYADAVNLLIIPDQATALAGLRTGKIDAVEGFPYDQAQNLLKTNPDATVLGIPGTKGLTLDPMYTVKPFSDIRVREAMQMAINLPEIAANYYHGTCSPTPLTLTSDLLTGWGFPYSQWPQDLKDQYAFNPTAAKQLLTDAGYANGFTTNVVADGSGDLTLLQIVQSYLAAVNINMSITTLDPAAWIQYALTNHKLTQLGYRSVGRLAGTFEPTRQTSTFFTGSGSNYQLVSDPNYDALYAQSLVATTVDQIKQVLMQMNKLVAQQHYAISLLLPNVFAIYQPWLKGYNGQFGGASCPNPSGAPLLGFYQARFWIDQSLK